MKVWFAFHAQLEITSPPLTPASYAYKIFRTAKSASQTSFAINVRSAISCPMTNLHALSAPLFLDASIAQIQHSVRSAKMDTT